MELYDEFFKIVQRMNELGVAYAVVGGVAYSFHVQPRFTKDIDFLVDPADIAKVSDALLGLGYFESSPPWTFKNTALTLYRFMKTEGEDYLPIDVMTGDDEHYKRIISEAIELDSQIGVIKLASKMDLIWLKSLRGSERDRLDIKDLENDQD